MEHSSANSVISFIIFNLVAQFKHMESLILGDPGEVSRDDRMFVVKVYRKTFTTNILSSRLIAPRSSRLLVAWVLATKQRTFVLLTVVAFSIYL